MELYMNKSIVNMSNWEVYVYNEQYNLSGVADKHPKLGNDFYVAYTSSLVKASFEEDILVYETRNTIYHCPLKYMRTNPYRNVREEYKEELIHRADASDYCLDRIIAASAKLATGKRLNDPFVVHILEITAIGKQELDKLTKEKENRLIEIAKQYADCVYLEVSCIEYGDKLAYSLGDKCGTVNPDLHSGMFQDSILYMKYREAEEDCALDFRYFPRGFGHMETYSWSDNIKQAVIKNVQDESIVFNGIEIKPGETSIFTMDSHKQGLISPDCYNGKSILTMNLKYENEE